jgi:hypothetical protein
VDNDESLMDQLGKVSIGEMTPQDNGGMKVSSEITAGEHFLLWFRSHDKFGLIHGMGFEDGAGFLKGPVMMPWDEWVARFAKRTGMSQSSISSMEAITVSEPTELAYSLLRDVLGEGNAWVFELPDFHYSGWPRFWELLSFALPGTARRKLFDPAFNDLMADYLKTRQTKYQTPAARRWLNLCFTAHTVGLVLLCVGISLRGAVFGVLMLAVPLGLRSCIKELWYSLFQRP